MNNPASPTVYSPGAKPALPASSSSDIPCVAWNRQVAHILASASYGGVTSIWDLKAKRTVITFMDRAHQSTQRTLVWNPNEPTSILTASETDAYPVVQMWDLRNYTQPVGYLQGIGSFLSLRALRWYLVYVVVSS